MNEFARPNLAVDQLPPANSADKDKVLTIDANGVPVWAENSGGGSGGGGVLVVHANADTGALDKTWQEIYDATANGQIPVIYDVGDDYSTLYYVAGVSNLSLYGDGYVVSAMSAASSAFSYNEWVADSASGYPMPND